jgi:hypothetical protein
MIFASEPSGYRIKAFRKGKALCPACRAEVIAKCGKINVWHWAHKKDSDCDSWADPDTRWHLGWKNLFPEWSEIMVEKDGKRHRADLLLPNGIVVELQHSYISPDEIREREQFYGRMIWIFDIQDCLSLNPDTGEPRFLLWDKGSYWTFRWKHPKKHIAFAKATTWLDLGDEQVFVLKKFYTDEHYAGWGYVQSKFDLLYKAIFGNLQN